MLLLGKNVLLGVSGGIAAYKTPDLVRKLVAKGASVRVVLTSSAEHFVSPLSLQAVSGNTVSNDLLDPAAEAAMGHIELAKWADYLVIAPATANLLAKMANGIADDLLTTLYLASVAKTVVAPAMNQQMWQAASVKRNIALLSGDGVEFIGPAAGEQACGDVGPGRMVEPQDIADYIDNITEVEQTLSGKTVLITAGPTREAIDPVRYISNHSSGKMGYALASAAKAAGANVVLVSGPVSLSPPAGVERVNVDSAQSMHDAVMAKVNDADIFIACAAVADYRAIDQAENKIKKTSDELTLTFTKNPDILKDVAALPKAPFTLGFAAESQKVEHYARGKLEKKKLNMIAANDISIQGLGFNSDQNALHVFWPEGDKVLSADSKTNLAHTLISLMASHYNNK
ncbi:bifunctional phosphopantothenoylcysteine decarboxylase/phosphopantothenate--cysteine ligase CoaBC [Alteromonas sp. 5E99-2]|uniref:bifunctional phosphopantothenoylcysteine decarboxylase/phosphopantothenate--cysteine ligase CoaBC n=1 Tax=Alteromonas sp. 5E99-2 TaxID=2817683 RepID=UPI001A9A1006|nr:bifunctional phosphopantothenoylcysteine decarboxylase/phosphopantothenate--cysteine ligase CoaBC [Alteromonas sp. 5E99-2]